MSLVAEGVITIYDADNVKMRLEGLEIYYLLLSCAELHQHPELQRKLGLDEEHVVVDENQWGSVHDLLNDIDPKLGRRMIARWSILDS